MAYRSLRKFKQQQREYERQQNKAQDDYFEPTEPPTEAQRASQWDSEYWQRIDNEVTYFSRVQ